jgi:transcriptional regulator with XRE-family HTH domain
MVDRIKKIMEKEKCSSPANFADTIKVNRTTITHILSGRNKKPSTDVLLSILDTYKNINPDWLLLGNLPMYRGEKAGISPEPTLFDNIPVYQSQPKDNSKNQEEIIDKKEEAPAKTPNLQSIMPELSLSENIDKIIIFFKNKTFVTLKPEE